MLMKMTRLAFAGNIGALGASGLGAPVALAAFASAAAASVASAENARYPNPADALFRAARRETWGSMGSPLGRVSGYSLVAQARKPVIRITARTGIQHWRTSPG